MRGENEMEIREISMEFCETEGLIPQPTLEVIPWGLNINEPLYKSSMNSIINRYCFNKELFLVYVLFKDGLPVRALTVQETPKLLKEKSEEQNNE